MVLGCVCSFELDCPLLREDVRFDTRFIKRLVLEAFDFSSVKEPVSLLDRGPCFFCVLTYEILLWFDSERGKFVWEVERCEENEKRPLSDLVGLLELECLEVNESSL